jgi:hypothetical protein
MRLRYIAIPVVLIGLILIYFSINPASTRLFPKCLLYVSTGIYCPGCGSQRATHALLNGNILTALNHNVLFIVGLGIIGYHLLVTALNKWFGRKIFNYLYHPKVPLILLGIVIAFWILRNIPFGPFNWLAPD